MPLPTHRRFTRIVTLRIQQEPHAPTRRPRARARIVPSDAPLEIVRPSDVRPIPFDTAATDHINEALHLTAPESKVARRAQLCASHWVQGSPPATVSMPPAAQAIISLRYFYRHFLDRREAPLAFTAPLICG